MGKRFICVSILKYFNSCLLTIFLHVVCHLVALNGLSSLFLFILLLLLFFSFQLYRSVPLSLSTFRWILDNLCFFFLLIFTREFSIWLDFSSVFFFYFFHSLSLVSGCVFRFFFFQNKFYMFVALRILSFQSNQNGIRVCIPVCAMYNKLNLFFLLLSIHQYNDAIYLKKK